MSDQPARRVSGAARRQVVEAIECIREELRPRLDALVVLLEQENPPAADWFGTWRPLLENLRAEDDVLLFFVEHLAPSAMAAEQFALSLRARAALDELLAAAQTIAATFSADDSQPH